MSCRTGKDEERLFLQLEEDEMIIFHVSLQVVVFVFSDQFCQMHQIFVYIQILYILSDHQLFRVESQMGIDFLLANTENRIHNQMSDQGTAGVSGHEYAVLIS